jgi:uncharacterized protein YdaU (DUF1376 family)
MHYYKRNLGDYAKKAGRLSMLEHGSYTLLIDACYDREQFPTLDEAIDWCWARSEAEIEAVKFVLNKFFTLDGSIYVQKRIQEELAEYHAKAEKNKEIATERESKRKESKEKARTVYEPSPQKHEAPPNHKPLTINHKPKEEDTHFNTREASVDNSAQGCVSVDNLKPETENGKPSTAANKVCNALALAGMADVSPRHPDVLALIEKGVSPDQFFSAAQTAFKGGKGFNFAVGILKNQLRDASSIAGLPSMPAAAWDADPQSVAAMAERLGVKPWQQATSENAFKGEAYPVFLMRVSAAYHAANEVAA